MIIKIKDKVNGSEVEFENNSLITSLQSYGLNQSSTLIEVESAIQKSTSTNFKSIWDQRLANLINDGDGDRNTHETKMNDDVMDKMGWKSTSNLQSYLNGSKPMGKSLISKMAEFLNCRSSDINPLINDVELASFKKKIKENRNLEKETARLKVSENIRYQWGKYKARNPGITQDIFCKRDLGFKTQSSFSLMLSGRGCAVKEENIKALSLAFGCSILDIDPNMIDHDNLAETSVLNLKKSLKSLLKLLDSSLLSKEELVSYTEAQLLSA